MIARQEVSKVFTSFAHPGTTGSSVERIRESRARESFNKVSDERTRARKGQKVSYDRSTGIAYVI